MLRSLAIILALLVPAPSLAAQQDVPFHTGGGSISSQITIPMMWQGKPALLVMGAPGNYVRISYDSQYPPLFPARQTPAFTLAGLLTYDERTCAPGSTLFAADDDFETWFQLGVVPANGIFEWFGAERIAYDKRYLQTGRPKTYRINYCKAPEPTCYTQCGAVSGYSGPGYVAMLLVYEGLSW